MIELNLCCSFRVCVRVLSNRAFKEEVVLRVLLLLMNIDLMMIVKSCIRKKEKIETWIQFLWTNFFSLVAFVRVFVVCSSFLIMFFFVWLRLVHLVKLVFRTRMYILYQVSSNWNKTNKKVPSSTYRLAINRCRYVYLTKQGKSKQDMFVVCWLLRTNLHKKQTQKWAIIIITKRRRRKEKKITVVDSCFHYYNILTHLHSIFIILYISFSLLYYIIILLYSFREEEEKTCILNQQHWHSFLLHQQGFRMYHLLVLLHLSHLDHYNNIMYTTKITLTTTTTIVNPIYKCLVE